MYDGIEVIKMRLRDIALTERVGEQVTIEALLRDARTSSMKNGGYFLTLSVMDGKREYDLVQFGVKSEVAQEYIIGAVYQFQINVKTYEAGKDGLSLQLVNSQQRTDLNPADFYLLEERYNEAVEKLYKYLRELEPTIVGRIAYVAFESNWQKFSTLPAASSMHHIYTGGLVVHTVNVADISLLLAQHYNHWYRDANINTTLLIAGALLHDIGKVVEYDLTAGNAAQYSGAGVLTPHIVSGLSIVSAIAEKLNVLSTPQVQELLHLIASHHGRAEWGSAVEPHTIEADILSNADMIDATISRRVLLNYNEPVGEGKSKRLGSQKFATYVSVPDPASVKI